VADPAANPRCLGITATNVIPLVRDANQFGGSGVVLPVPPSDERLCLPSTVELPGVT